MSANNAARTAAARERKSRTTVLHLVPELELNPQARELVDLAILTHRGGWRPLIASSGGPLVLEAERAAVRHTRMPLNRQHFLATWRNRVQLEALFQRERPAIVHAHGFDMLPQAYGLNLVHKVPLLIDLTEPAVVTPRLKKLLHAASSKQARFRVPSEFMAQHLRQDFELRTDLLYHVPPGIDLLWYDAVRVSPERLQNLSKLWRLPEQGTVIVMATPLTQGSGHRALLEALAQLKRNDIFVVMVGDDRAAPGMRAEIEQLVSTYGLEGKVIMPESCTDWPAACWLASIVVATNAVPRGQAMELLAAQAIGRPVIVTDCGANREMVKAGETAWVIAPDDKAALSQALLEAIQMNAAQRIDLAMRTRDFVADMFPQRVWCQSLFELYGSILARPMEQIITQAA